MAEEEGKGLMGANDRAAVVLAMFYFLTSVPVPCCFLCNKVLSSVFRSCAFL